MNVRSTAKAIIIKDRSILLNKCHDENNGYYYSLPGGGQHKYETLHEAVIRECLEETGYTISPIKLIALSEEICTDESFREKCPEYAHKMYHIFICELANENMKIPTEKDDMQLESEWIDIDSLQNIRLLPKAIGNNILGIIGNTSHFFLGSEYCDFNHG